MEELYLYQVDLYSISSSDTVFISSYQFETPDFSCNIKESDCVRISVSAFGYHPLLIDTCLKTNIINLDKINLNIKEFGLQEIAISHKRPIVKIKGSTTTVNIKNSILADIGDATDVMERLPGVVRRDDSFSVLRKGKPIIYIDWREITNMEELAILKSQYISDIKIDRSPSSIYGANTNAIIEITTIPILKYVVDLQFTNNATFRRKVGNYSTAQINYKKQKLVARLNYGYSFGGSKLTESSNQTIYNSDYTFHNNLDYKNDSKSQNHNLSGMINLQLNAKNRIGMQYIGQYNNSDQSSDKDQKFGANGFQ